MKKKGSNMIGKNRQPLVLTIDDEKNIRESFRFFLEDYDYNVLEAENGRIGLEIFKKKQPDIVLVDLRMPEMDGLDVLAEITSISEDIPVIVISGTGLIRDAVEALHLGAWDYLLKPIEDMSILLHAIEKGLERSRLIRENREYQEHLETIVARRTKELEQANISLHKINDQLQVSRQELVAANDNLEKRVDERTAELVRTNMELMAAKDVADAAARAKSEFLANMSHEIRTPLNGVIAAADLALAEKMSPESMHLIETINLSGSTLLNLINDILDFSKIEAGKLDIEIRPFRLDELLDDVVTPFINKVAEKEIELLIDVEPGTPAFLEGDKLRIQQILMNLLSNAVKFTGKNGIVSIGVNSSSNLDDTDSINLNFVVKDTGIGMDKEFITRLFQPFTQEDSSTTRRFGGTGLGLSISKQLVEMMNGEIRVKSDCSKGSTFYFSLCLKLHSEGMQEKILTIPEDLLNLHILIVEKCPDTRVLLQKILNFFGFKTKSATSTQEAENILLKSNSIEKPFDLVIIDSKTSDMGKTATVDVIRENLNMNLPFLMMSVSKNEDILRDLGKKKINGFLIKPFQISSLYDAIMMVFGKVNLLVGTSKKNSAAHSLSCKKLVSGTKILVAEDNIVNQDIIMTMLSGAGIDVTIVDNGHQAVQAAQDNRFDAVLMDIQMPEMDGYEATAGIRKNYDHKSLPIIAMTAHALKGDEEKCLAAGMDGYVAKPIRQDRLFSVLAEKIYPAKAADLGRNVYSGSIYNSEVESQDSGYFNTISDDMPGISIKKAMQALCIEKSAYKKILTRFSTEHKNFTRQAEELFKLGDWQNLSRLAHSIKGSSANIGAYDVQTAARTLELTCIDGGRPDISMIMAVNDALTLVFDSINFLTDLPEEIPVPSQEHVQTQIQNVNSAQIEPVLKELADSLKMADPELIGNNLENIKKYLAYSKLISIENNIDNYEYDEAIKDLQKIAEDFKIELN